MIIVNQDKNEIINFDNINAISIREHIFSNSTDKKDYKIISYDNTYRSCDVYADTIGTYATEERAKEVLQEIIERIENWENLKAGQPSGICKFVYEMPEE